MNISCHMLHVACRPPWPVEPDRSFSERRPFTFNVPRRHRWTMEREEACSDQCSAMHGAPRRQPRHLLPLDTLDGAPRTAFQVSSQPDGNKWPPFTRCTRGFSLCTARSLGSLLKWLGARRGRFAPVAGLRGVHRRRLKAWRLRVSRRSALVHLSRGCRRLVGSGGGSPQSSPESGAAVRRDMPPGAALRGTLLLGARRWPGREGTRKSTKGGIRIARELRR